MGLEHLELGIRVEEEFKVVIADEDYEHLKTIGDLEQYIKDHSTSVWPCPHIPAFSKLQKSLVAITGCSEEEVRLETPLSKFSDPTKRKQVWERLQSESGLKLPKMYSTLLLHDFMKALMWLVFPLAIYALVLFFRDLFIHRNDRNSSSVCFFGDIWSFGSAAPIALGQMRSEV